MGNKEEDIIARDVESLLAKTPFASRGRSVQSQPSTEASAQFSAEPTQTPAQSSPETDALGERLSRLEGRFEELHLKTTALVASQRKQIAQIQSQTEARVQNLQEFEKTFASRHKSFVDATARLADRIVQIGEQIQPLLDNQDRFDGDLAAIRSGLSCLEEASREIRSVVQKQENDESAQVEKLKGEVVSLLGQSQESNRRLQEQLDDLSSLLAQQDARVHSRLTNVEGDRDTYRSELMIKISDAFAERDQTLMSQAQEIKALREDTASTAETLQIVNQERLNLEASLSRTNEQINSNEKTITELVAHAEADDKRFEALGEHLKAIVAETEKTAVQNARAIEELTTHAAEEDVRLETFGEHLKAIFAETQETALRNKQSLEDLTRHAQKCDALLKALGVQQQQDRESLEHGFADVIRDRKEALEVLQARIESSESSLQQVKAFLETLIAERAESILQRVQENESAIQIWSALVTELESRIKTQEDQIQEIRVQSRSILADLESLKAEDTVGQDQILTVQRQVEAIQLRFDTTQAEQARRTATLTPSDYFVFEDRFRGDEEDVRKRQSRFLNLFKGCHHVLDIGCGRGEFLDLLTQSGIGASGIDLNPVMVEYCQKRGLRVAQADAFDFLQSVEDGRLDGVYCGQMIEHLTAEEQIAFIKLVYQKMRFNSHLIIETMNPLNLPTAATHFYTDLSHKRPVTPDGLGFLLSAVGFRKVQFDSLSDTPEEDKLVHIPLGAKPSAATKKLVERINGNLDKINQLLFAYRDFAAMALK